MAARDYLHAVARQMKMHLHQGSEPQEGQIPKNSSRWAFQIPESRLYKAVTEEDWLVVWNMCYLSIYCEESSQLTNIFHRG